jgi:hypothetical protein
MKIGHGFKLGIKGLRNSAIEGIPSLFIPLASAYPLESAVNL